MTEVPLHHQVAAAEQCELPPIARAHICVRRVTKVPVDGTAGGCPRFAFASFSTRDDTGVLGLSPRPPLCRQRHHHRRGHPGSRGTAWRPSRTRHRRRHRGHGRRSRWLAAVGRRRTLGPVRTRRNHRAAWCPCRVTSLLGRQSPSDIWHAQRTDIRQGVSIGPPRAALPVRVLCRGNSRCFRCRYITVRAMACGGAGARGVGSVRRTARWRSW